MASKLLALFICLALPLFAASEQTKLPSFTLPLACTPGENCWVANYVDQDRSANAADYRCGALTYDGHNGTDIAVRDMSAIRAGVPVLAAADGKVLRLRNGEPEGTDTEARGASKKRRRECGNGLVIDHGMGWTTQYCHLRRDSVRVNVGQEVKRGEGIGLVGVSGNTEFPHLHFTTRYQGKIVDPFKSIPDTHCESPPSKSLWQPDTASALQYQHGQIFNAGFTDASPDTESIVAGHSKARILECSAKAIIAWMQAFNVREGDLYRFKLQDPDGKSLIEQEEILERSQARILRFGGKRLRANCWMSGNYQADFAILAGPDHKQPLSSHQVTIRVR